VELINASEFLKYVILFEIISLIIELKQIIKMIFKKAFNKITGGDDPKKKIKTKTTNKIKTIN